MPPFADIKKDLGEMVEYNGTLNIVKAINYYNPKCFLLYASSTTLYGNVLEASVKSKLQVTELDYYSSTKKKCEELIKDKLKNYTIIRLPFILCNPKSGAFMYNVKLNTMLEAISDNDAGFLFVRALDKIDKLNKKIFNAGGGSSCQSTYREILANVLSIYGLSFNFVLIRTFMDKNFYSHIYTDSDTLNELLDYESDSLYSYYMRLKRKIKNKRIIPRLLAKPLVFFLKRKK